LEHCNIEFINEVDSTNEHLKRMVRSKPIKGPFCVSASSQINGKGQRGKVWKSDPYVNVMASYLVDDEHRLDDLASMSAVVACSIANIVSECGVKDVKIKWPNDLYVGDNKIAGILIEPLWSGKQVKQIIVGIGLNINQMVFPDLSATSILLETGNIQQVGDILVALYKMLYRNIGAQGTDFLAKMNEILYKKDSSVTFEIDGRMEEYTVKQVLKNGNLKVEKGNGNVELEHHRVKWVI